jgi:hypothetical protein
VDVDERMRVTLTRAADTGPDGTDMGISPGYKRSMECSLSFIVTVQSRQYSSMGYWQAALVKVGMAQPGPKITAHDRAILEYVADLR